MATPRQAASHVKSRHGRKRGHSHKKHVVHKRRAVHKKHKRPAHHKHHVKKRHHKKHRHHKTSVHGRSYGAPGGAAPIVSPTPPPPSNGPVPVLSRVATEANVRRLLWRAGFGPTPGQAEGLTGRSIQELVYGLTRPAG